MKRIHNILDWGMLLGIVAGSVFSLYWIDTLSTTSIAKMVLSIGLVILAWVLINQWITSHEIRLLVESVTNTDDPSPAKYYRFEIDPDMEHDHG